MSDVSYEDERDFDQTVKKTLNQRLTEKEQSFPVNVVGRVFPEWMPFIKKDRAIIAFRSWLIQQRDEAKDRYAEGEAFLIEQLLEKMKE
jgi:hypothetical protein